ncbi:MAG: GNAT family N-acetyltransferase [Clostridia bacterium]|nr:GNAT family N-acetyltransferase [Clostridia bacterium]
MHCSLIEAVSPQDFSAIAALAQRVWHTTYDALIGPSQVDYMLEKFQSADAIASSIQENRYRYLMAVGESGLIGYCGVKEENPTDIFLSKVYVDPDFQGNGIAKAMIQFFIDEYRASGHTRMHLTVNKGNQNAISAYLKMGFIKFGTAVTDIGSGYVMDDDLMELKLN